MKVLSFDIGIENLAYCVQDDDLNILYWENINLLKNINHKCQGKKQDNSDCVFFAKYNTNKLFLCETHYKNQSRCHKCKGKATYQHNNLYYCSKHRVNDKKIDGKKECIGFLKNGKKCSFNAKYCLDDIYYCNRHKTENCKIIEKIKTKQIIKTNSNNIRMHELYILITHAFDERPYLLDVDYVILELQGTYNPRFSNIKMKSISTIIHQYFVIRGMIDKKTIQDIKYMHAKTALTCYDGPEIKVETKTKSGKTKSRRQIKKEQGYHQCQFFLKNNIEKLNYILEYDGPKYDLSDAHLIGRTFIKRFNKK